MSARRKSNITFFILLAVLALATGLNTYLPQGPAAATAPPSALPKWQLALGAAGIVLVVYGGLGFIGLTLWRKLDFPDIWDDRVTNRQRFLVPGLAGAALGMVLIIADLAFSRFNGVGRLMHPPFPTSLVAALAAGIGEEMLFRLFFISFWTWLVGKLILRGRGLTVVYWVVAVWSALVFAAAHLPSLIFLLGVSSPAQLPPALLLEGLLLNGLIGIFAAYYFKKYGFLAPVGIHFWTDFVWHVLWGLF
jgi:membrane protease YdiL (CAAX protease family)